MNVINEPQASRRVNFELHLIHPSLTLGVRWLEGSQIIMKKLRVAVIGANGIGKNHIGWFLKHGCDVCAFVGSSPQSVSSTRQVLQSAWNIEPRAYDSTETMLREEKPDAVCIASPPHLHFEQTRQCLESGAHVLCEKPLVGGENKTHRVLVEQAQALCKAARDCRRLLGTQMQYAVATPTILQLCSVEIGAMRSLIFTMNTKNIQHGRARDDVWLDLSPHPLSVLRKIAPLVQLHQETIRCVVQENQTVANFQMTFAHAQNAHAQNADAKETRCDVEIRVAVDAWRDVPLRRFQINENIVDYAARKNDSGEFRAYLSTQDRVLEVPDFVDSLVENFVRACRGEEPLLVTGEDGAQVVDWQYKLLQKGESK